MKERAEANVYPSPKVIDLNRGDHPKLTLIFNNQMQYNAFTLCTLYFSFLQKWKECRGND